MKSHCTVRYFMKGLNNNVIVVITQLSKQNNLKQDCDYFY